MQSVKKFLVKLIKVNSYQQKEGYILLLKPSSLLLSIKLVTEFTLQILFNI